MMNLKRKICLTAAGALFSILLAGCGVKDEAAAKAAAAPAAETDTAETKAAAAKTAAVSTGDKAGPKTKLTVWLPPFGTEDTLDKQVWGEILKPFEEEQNAEVTIEIVPWSNYEEKYLTGVSSGQGPDIGYMYMEMISDFIKAGAITPLDDYLTAGDRNNFYYLDKGVIDKKQYGLPIVVGNAKVLFYNKAILKEAGVDPVPETWDEFVAACLKVKAVGRKPFLLQWGSKSKGALNTTFFPFLWQAGGEIFDQEGTKAAFDSEAGLKAAQFLYDLRFRYGIMPDSATAMSVEQVNQEFRSGDLAFIISPTSSGKRFTEAGIDWGYLVSLKDKQQGTFAAADSLVLLSGSKHKELAVKLMKFMLSGPSMTRYHAMAQFPPIARDEEYHDDPAFRSLYEDHKNDFRVLPAVQGSTAVYDDLYKNLQLMMLGQMTPEEAVRKSADYANTVLSQNR